MHDPARLQQIADLRRVGLRLKSDIAWLRCLLAFRRFALAAIKANFSPGQLRIPAGQPGGGQWTDGDGGGLTLIGARGRASVSIRVGNRVMEATPAQATRLAVTDAWARTTAEQVREIDPTWRPTPSLTTSVEGEIAARVGEAREAEARLRELESGRFGDNNGPTLEPSTPRAGTGTPSPSQCITAYRSLTGMPDIGDRPAIPRSDGTVAFAQVDGRPVIGVNSDAPGYTMADQAAAEAMRARLVERYPEVMATDNLGHIPNNALFHAEANALLRAAEPSGSLAGREIDMRVDRMLCPSCDRVLPLVGLDAGNPTVRITDGSGALWIMRDGAWIRRGRP